MLTNIQRYFVRALFAAMIFVCAFHGMTDARRHHGRLGKSHSKHLKHHYSKGNSRIERFG